MSNPRAERAIRAGMTAMMGGTALCLAIKVVHMTNASQPIIDEPVSVWIAIGVALLLLKAVRERD